MINATDHPLHRFQNAVTALRNAQRELDMAQRALTEYIEDNRLCKGRAPARCGTDGGYYRHVRTTKTPPCEACLHAHRVAERKRADARRTKAA